MICPFCKNHASLVTLNERADELTYGGNYIEMRILVHSMHNYRSRGCYGISGALSFLTFDRTGKLCRALEAAGPRTQDELMRWYDQYAREEAKAFAL